MTEAVQILGIDPGYDRAGWAIGAITDDNLAITAHGCITTDPKASTMERYTQIIHQLTSIIKKYSPIESGIETLFFSKNVSTAIQVSEARGIIIGCLLEYNISVSSYNPGTIKLTVTGDGKADKKAVAKMIQLQTGIETSKELDDAIDAIAVVITHAINR